MRMLGLDPGTERLHVLNRASAGIHGSQDPAMEEALARFDLLDSVNTAMQGLRGDNFAGFMHTSQIPRTPPGADRRPRLQNASRYHSRDPRK